jgi:hypothetical protein
MSRSLQSLHTELKFLRLGLSYVEAEKPALRAERSGTDLATEPDKLDWILRDAELCS